MQLKFKILISIFILIGIIYFIDYNKFINIIKQIDIFLFILSVFCQFLSTAIASYRWFYIMKILNFKENLIFYFKTYFKATFYNQLLPSSIGGDALRVLNMKQLNYSFKDSFFSVLIDRAFGIFALIVINIIANMLNTNIIPQELYWSINIICIVGILGTIFASLANKIKILNGIQKLSFFMDMSKTFYEVFKNTKKFIIQLFLSIFVHIAAIASLYILSLSVNLNIDFIDFLLVVPLVILLSVLPISISGWGLREGAMVGLFSLLNASKEGILAVSILYGVVVVITSLLGFIFWLNDKKNYF